MIKAASFVIETVICFHDVDRPHLDALDTHLAPLRHEKLLRLWHAGMLEAGRNREAELLARLAQAQLVLLLISSDFNAQWDKRIASAIQQRRIDDVRVVPVMLRPCIWSGLPYFGLSPLPQSGKPLIIDGTLDEVQATLFVSELRSLVVALRSGGGDVAPISTLAHSALFATLAQIERERCGLENERSLPSDTDDDLPRPSLRASHIANSIASLRFLTSDVVIDSAPDPIITSAPVTAIRAEGGIPAPSSRDVQGSTAPEAAVGADELRDLHRELRLALTQEIPEPFGQALTKLEKLVSGPQLNGLSLSATRDLLIRLKRSRREIADAASVDEGETWVLAVSASIALAFAAVVTTILWHEYHGPDPKLLTSAGITILAFTTALTGYSISPCANGWRRYVDETRQIYITLDSRYCALKRAEETSKPNPNMTLGSDHMSPKSLVRRIVAVQLMMLVAGLAMWISSLALDLALWMKIGFSLLGTVSVVIALVLRASRKDRERAADK